jgi:hypothetical protein
MLDQSRDFRIRRRRIVSDRHEAVERTWLHIHVHLQRVVIRAAI